MTGDHSILCSYGRLPITGLWVNGIGSWLGPLVVDFLVIQNRHLDRASWAFNLGHRQAA